MIRISCVTVFIYKHACTINIHSFELEATTTVKYVKYGVITINIITNTYNMRTYDRLEV